MQTYKERKALRRRKIFWLSPEVADKLSQLASENHLSEVSYISNLIVNAAKNQDLRTITN